MPGNLFIIWSDLYATGIPIIDEQHRCVVGAINTLFYFMRKQRASDVLLPTLSLLHRYAQIHFLTEEELMEMTGYPDVAIHKKQHELFHRRLRAISIESKKTFNTDTLLFFLKGWWVEHISSADIAYAPHVLKALQSQGMA